ncbi:hypothetical protein BIV60_08685 [Bacillus sp. MUM 116]|uniref:phosphotransferase n=1 Tax=Bacillus sp. MUM 116 TaxID=1678002 RepID=UPI0008F56A69|nr:phosphotransferase [Bacillus sp. MUM 116]OIK15610.1 hypothetical protein BIV60_08685 [Bacillus sp. MUM 116]
MYLSELTYSQYEDMKENQEFWNEKMIGILTQWGKNFTCLKRYSYGANIVYNCDDKLVIKLFPDHLNDQFIRELAVLEAIQEKVKIVETPRLIHHGSFEGWSFIIMTLVEGELLIDIWYELSFDEKINLSKDLAKTIKEFHRIPLNGLEKTLPNNWREFIEHQFRNMKAYHQSLGLDESFLKELELYVEEFYLEKNPKKTLLTGEYTPYNLLMNQVDGKWKLNGVIDFADCFLGDADYDLLGPILFMFNSNQPLIYAFLDSYGYPGLNDYLQKKLMSYAILHRFSDLSFFASQSVLAKQAKSIDELARILFPLK